MSHISAEIWHERHNIPAFIDPAHQRSSGKVVPQVIWSGIISSGEKSALPPCFGKMPLCPARWNLSAVRILKKPFSLARKTVINSTQISHIIRHNNSRGRISASPADPRRHIAAGIQRAGTLYSVPALVSWSYSFLRIPATVLSIAEAKSEGSRDFVGFSSGISRDKVGASPILPEVPAQHNQKGRGTIRRSPRAFGHRIRFAPYSAHPAVPFLCC